MNGVFFTRLKAKKLFRFNKEVPTAVASIPIAFETVIVVMNCSCPSLTVLRQNGANNSLRFFDRRKDGMIEPRGKSSFNLGLVCRMNKCFLIMLPTSGKFGLNEMISSFLFHES